MNTFGANSDFEFRLYDLAKAYTFKIKTEHMMVDGKHFSDTSSTCYIPVFNHGLDRTDDDKKTIYVGNTFMQDYYVVYDMSQYDSKKYLQVGLAPQADWNQGLAKHYDREGGHYKPGNAKVWDKSAIRDGECDQYDPVCNGDDSPNQPPTDLMELDECLALATKAVEDGKSKEVFVGEIEDKALKYKSNPAYSTVM